MILSQLCDSKCVKDFWTMYAKNMTSFLHKIQFLSENCDRHTRHRRDNDEQQLRWNELSETAAKKLEDFTNQFNSIANNCSVQNNEMISETKQEDESWNFESIQHTFSVLFEQKLMIIIGIIVVIVIMVKCICKR